MFEATRRATVSKVLTWEGGPPEWRYLIHLDTGEDIEARHDQIGFQGDHSTRERLEAAGFTGDSWGFTSAVNEVVYANRGYDYFAKHPEDGPPARPQPSQDNIIDALSLLPRCREEFDGHERELIDAARAAGATWEQIGLALGYTVKGARQGASQRRKKLGS